MRYRTLESKEGVCPGVSAQGDVHPIDRITQACENITFLQLLMRMVIKCFSEIWPQFDATITICDINIRRHQNNENDTVAMAV